MQASSNVGIMDPNKSLFQKFLEERAKALDDIKQFLRAVLIFLVDMEINKFSLQEIADANENVSPLIQSLCLIHGLFGYPAEPGPSAEPEGTDETEEVHVHKDAVKEILKTIEEVIKEENETRTLAYYFEEITQNKFWKFEFSGENVTLQTASLHREPAHIFLKMVNNLLKDHAIASVVGKEVLESLADENRLKPKVWAEHNMREDRYGVSLGIRPFLRPLYLYIKMKELKGITNDSGLELNDVTARIREAEQGTHSEYVTPIEPCLSCEIFFNNREREKRNINVFANCAEYDVIQTSLNAVLDNIANNGWQDIRTACEGHFSAFNEMTQRLNNPENLSHNEKREIMETYIRDASRDAKILIYKRNSSMNNYELVLINTGLATKIQRLENEQ